MTGSHALWSDLERGNNFSRVPIQEFLAKAATGIVGPAPGKQVTDKLFNLFDFFYRYYQREIRSCFSWMYALCQRKINDHKKTIVHKVVSPPTRANNADATTGIEGTLWTFIANTKTSQSIKTIEFCHHKQWIRVKWKVFHSPPLRLLNMMMHRLALQLPLPAIFNSVNESTVGKFLNILTLCGRCRNWLCIK